MPYKPKKKYDIVYFDPYFYKTMSEDLNSEDEIELLYDMDLASKCLEALL